MGKGCIIKLRKWLSRTTYESPEDCEKKGESLRILVIVLVGIWSDLLIFFFFKLKALSNAAQGLLINLQGI